jgi:hypothetical protein
MDLESLTKNHSKPVLATKLLSYTSITFLSLLFLLILFIAFTDTLHWSFIEITLLFLHPLLLSILFHRLKLHQFVQFDSVVRVFAAGFLPGALLATSWQYTSQFLLTKILEKSNVFLIVLTCYGTTAFVEEVVKFGIVKGKSAAFCFAPIVNKNMNQMTPRAIALAAIILTTSGAAGFATVENIAYFGVLRNVTPNSIPHVSIQTLLYRTIIPSTLHIICGIMTGVNLSRYQHNYTNVKISLFSMLLIIFPSVFVHGTFNILMNLNIVSSSWFAMWLFGISIVCVSNSMLMYCVRALRHDLRTSSSQHNLSNTKVWEKTIITDTRGRLNSVGVGSVGNV